MSPAHTRIAILGTGFSGICLAIQLKRAGIDSFTLYEKAGRIGGTWRENTYPGAACDTPSFSYCFSFEQKTDWTRKWSPQPEILEYLEHCVRKHDLARHIRFDTEIERARFDGDSGSWKLQTTGGEAFSADVLVSSVGQLNRPSVPDLPGLGEFQGEAFHSARWNHAYDFTDRDVAVIGNAASAIQFIPQIAPQVRNLLIFQRSANWMIPKFDRAYSAAEHERFARFPWLARLYRWWIWLAHESRFPVFRQNRFLSRRFERWALRWMRSQVADPELRQALTPDYPIGGKRILISDDYYPTLGRENVHVVTTEIDRITRDGVVTRDGKHHPVDALVFATGFESTRFLAPMKLEGPGGRPLDDAWKEGAEAYLGMTVSGFPNFFMMYGPNTNLGHNSIIFMIECQTHYIVECLRHMDRDGLKSIDVRAEVMASFNEHLQKELERTVWTRTDHSWYKTKRGRITNNWSGTTTEYWWKTRRPDLDDFVCERRSF